MSQMTHGTAVARGGRAVLITGAAGSGKSGLALALMALGGKLIADDAVRLTASGSDIVLTCPPEIKGIIEARGIGLLSVQSIDQARLAIVVDMDKTAAQRLPAPESIVILGVEFPLICGKNSRELAAAIWCLLGDGQRLPIA